VSLRYIGFSEEKVQYKALGEARKEEASTDLGEANNRIKLTV